MFISSQSFWVNLSVNIIGKKILRVVAFIILFLQLENTIGIANIYGALKNASIFLLKISSNF